MKTRTILIAGLSVTIAALAGGGGWLAHTAWADEIADVVHDKSEETQAIEGAKLAIATRMPEAESTTFGKVFVHWNDTMAAVCGDVDVVEAPDSFAGEERFVYTEGTLYLEEVDGSDLVTRKWRDVCE